MENKKYVEYAGDIHQSGNHLLALINDILEISKAVAGKFELTEQEFDVEKALAESVGMQETQIVQKNIRLDILVQRNLPPFCGDELRVRQIFLNRLSNAVKLTPENSLVTIDAFLDEGGLGIYISDTGMGISLEQQDQVFEEFSRTDSDRVRAIKGTGLGLPMSKMPAQLHGGSMALKSELNVGTTSQVWFPKDWLVSLAA